MKTKHLKKLLLDTAEEEIPAQQVNLWPHIKQRLVQDRLIKGGRFMRTSVPLRISKSAAAIFLLMGLAIITLFTIPQGRALAQEIQHFFTRAKSDRLPVQPFQLTPIAQTTTPDPGDINHASLSVVEVENQAGFDVLEPSWLPETLSLVGATYEPGLSIVRIFYRYVDTNGLVLKEEPFKRTDDCELCGVVGDSAAVETVQIGKGKGEYVEGVWKLTDTGPVWESDPYLKTLRWQANGMAFELLYMGPPDSLSKTDLIAIAEGLK